MTPVTNQVKAEDVLPVHGRVSWSAILSGATVALAIYVLLAAFGTALGFTIANRITDHELIIAAIVWAIFSVLVGLFVGGYVSTQCAVGENKTEAVISGLTVWGVLLLVLLWLGSSGMSLGFNAMIAAVNNPAVRTWDAQDLKDLSDAGVTQEQIARFKDRLPDATRDSRVTEAAWWTFGGIMVSMIAAICGALAGSGPRLVLRRVWLRRGPGNRVVSGQPVVNR